jgi:hypothetical protein
MRHGPILVGMTGDSRRPMHRRTVIIQCIDCEMVIGTEIGSTPSTEVQWSLCSRCVARRNGMVGAKTPNDLGIY